MKQNTKSPKRIEWLAEHKEQLMNSKMAWADKHPGRVALHRKTSKRSFVNPQDTIKKEKINDLCERFAAYRAALAV